MTRIRLNGREQTVNGGSTVASLLEAHGLGRDWVVVERNGEPLERTRFAEVELVEGDRVEIVRAVAGGA